MEVEVEKSMWRRHDVRDLAMSDLMVLTSGMLGRRCILDVDSMSWTACTTPWGLLSSSRPDHQPSTLHNLNRRATEQIADGVGSAGHGFVIVEGWDN